MDRRHFLVATGSMISLAGCQSLGDTSGSAKELEGTDRSTATTTAADEQTVSCEVTETHTETATPTDTPTETPTDTPTPTPVPATFTVEEFSSPDTAQISQGFDLTITVTNTGEQDGTFESNVSVRSSRRGWSTRGDPISLSVPAGDTVTTQVEIADGRDEISTFDARLEATGQTTTTEIVGRQLTFGQAYTTPDDVTVSVSEIQFRASYSQNGRPQEPATGNKFAMVHFVAENESSQLATAPYSYNITLIGNGDEYDNVLTTKHDNGYQGGDLYADVRREGVIPYEVPADLLLDDIRIAWSGFSTDPIAVYWSAE